MSNIERTKATALVMSSTFWTSPSKYDQEILAMLDYDLTEIEKDRYAGLVEFGNKQHQRDNDNMIIAEVEYLLFDYFQRLLKFAGGMHPKWRKNESIPKQYTKEKNDSVFPAATYYTPQSSTFPSKVTLLNTFYFNGVDTENSYSDTSVSMLISVMVYHMHMLFRFYCFMLFRESLSSDERLENRQGECCAEWFQILDLFGMSRNCLSIFDFYKSAPSNLLRYGWEDQTEISASAFYSSKRRNHIFLEGFVLDGKTTFAQDFKKMNRCLTVNESSILFRLHNNHMLTFHPEILPIAFFSSLCVSSFSTLCAANINIPLLYDRGIFATETFRGFSYGDTNSCFDVKNVSNDLSMCNLFLCFAQPNSIKVCFFEPKMGATIPFPLMEYKGDKAWRDRSFENKKIRSHDELMKYGNMFRQGLLFVIKRFTTQYS